MAEQRDVLYQRQLPGGGYVTVEDTGADAGEHRAELTVERRADPARRDGHAPPVVAVASGRTLESVFEELFAIASDNVAVARALLRWKASGEGRHR